MLSTRYVVRGRVVHASDPVVGAKVSIAERTRSLGEPSRRDARELTRLLDELPVERRSDAYRHITKGPIGEATTDSEGRFAVDGLHTAAGCTAFAIYASHEAPNGRFVKASVVHHGHLEDASPTAEGTIEIDAGDLYLAPVKTLTVLVEAGGSPLRGATVAFAHRDEGSPSQDRDGAEPPGWRVRMQRPLTPSNDHADFESLRVTGPDGLVREEVIDDAECRLDVVLTCPGFARELRSVGGEIAEYQRWRRNKRLGFLGRPEDAEDGDLTAVRPTLRVRLVPAASFTGRVSSTEGQTIAGATVTAHDQQRVVETVHADTAGVFSFQELAPQRSYALLVTPPTSAFVETLFAVEPPTRFEPRLLRAAALEVKVATGHGLDFVGRSTNLVLERMEHGVGASLAWAYLEPRSGEEIPVASFEGLVPGRYRVKFSADGAAPVSSPEVELSSGTKESIGLLAQPGRSVALRVVDGHGAPLGASVWTEFGSARCDKDGRVTIGSLPWEEQALLVGKDGYTSRRVTVPANVLYVPDVVLAAE